MDNTPGWNFSGYLNPGFRYLFSRNWDSPVQLKFSRMAAFYMLKTVQYMKRFDL